MRSRRDSAVTIRTEITAMASVAAIAATAWVTAAWAGPSSPLAACAVARTTFEGASPPPITSLASNAGMADHGPASGLGLAQKDATKPPGEDAMAEIFTAERAQVLLRSLTIPGWGQATQGRMTSAAVFGLVELGVWTSFAAFRIQEHMRKESYERSARYLAGIDLDGRDEEFRRIVGSYLSSEQYNQYVVFRDAANLYLSDLDNPDYDGYRAYIAENELRGEDTWSWQTVDDLLGYRAQRKNTHQASIRANTTVAIAVINRLVSALHAARAHSNGGASSGAPRSWNFEVTPSDPDDVTAFQLGVRARF